MKDLREPRPVFKPFEYPQAEDYCLKQQTAHWLHTELSMASDINDWATMLTDSERALVGSVLKGFTQTEVYVGAYWGQRVPAWFPKPEILLMASTFASMEAVHALAYSHLNTSLGLEDFDAFLYEPAAYAKIEAAIDAACGPSAPTKHILESIGTYSGLIEGVSLFSAFSILLSFSRRNLLKSVGQIVSWSVRDESLHSNAGCWLYRTLAQEAGMQADLQPIMLEQAAQIVKLEFDFIDMCFGTSIIEGLNPADVKTLIAHRANAKLEELGIQEQPFEVDHARLNRMRWFDLATTGVERQDFFANRPTAYSKPDIAWGSAF